MSVSCCWDVVREVGGPVSHPKETAYYLVMCDWQLVGLPHVGHKVPKRLARGNTCGPKHRQVCGGWS